MSRSTMNVPESGLGNTLCELGWWDSWGEAFHFSRTIDKIAGHLFVMYDFPILGKGFN